MRRIDLSTVKDCEFIWECGDYIVAAGKLVWVFRKDGSFVAKSSTIRYPLKIYFLPPDKAFIQGGANYQYHYIDLQTAEDIWTVPCGGRFNSFGKKFIASPDNKYLFDIYCNNKNFKHYVLRFSIENLTVAKEEVPESLRVTVGGYMDKEGVLYALQTHLLNDGKTSQNGILRIDWRDEKPIFSWKSLWQSEKNRFKNWRYTDGQYILCEDYTVVDMTTMHEFNLLENDSDWVTAYGPLDCVYIADRGLLIGYHDLEEGNVVIDCKARKRVAQYVSAKNDDEKAGFAGCLVGDEYWIGTEEGIVKKIFPIFEEMPEIRFPGWIYAKKMKEMRREQLNKEHKQ